MKELFSQSLVNEISESDRIASAIPGQVGAKNILFSKFWAQLKSIFGVNNWSARTYKSSPCIVVFDKKQYILDEAVAPLPFDSTDFATELADGKWLALGGGSSLASQADVEVASPTDNVKYTSPLRAFQGFIYWVSNSTVSTLQTTSKFLAGAINELLVLIGLRQAVNVGICESCPIYSTDILLDDATRTLTIATIKQGQTISASNPIEFFTSLNFVRSKWKKTTAQSVVWSATKGLKYIYFDNDGVLKSSDTVWTIGDVALVYRLYWNPALSGANRIVRVAIEMHPNTISADDHRWKHHYGAVWMSGFNIVCNQLASGAPASSGLNTCLSFTGGSCMDDNLLYTVNNSAVIADFNQDLGNTTAASITTANSAVMDITYNAPDGTLTIIDGTRFPFHAVAGVPQIITAGGIITPVPNGHFFNYYIYSFQDPRFGKAINLRSGLNYATKAEADAETWEQIKALSPTLQDGEVKQLYKVTGEFRTSYDIAVNKAVLRGFTDLRSNAAIASVGSAGGSGASIASNVAVTPPTGYVSTDMQGLSNEFGADIQALETAMATAGGWTEDLTAWDNTSAQLTLVSNVFKDLGNSSVIVGTYITLTPVVSPKLAEYHFRFIYGSGGGFYWPVGCTPPVNAPSLVAGKTYEVSIVRNKIKISEV